MISTLDMSALIKIASDTGASIRFQGDKGQFRAIDSGQPFAALRRLLRAAELRDIQRQLTPWQRAASMLLDGANNSVDEKDAAAKIAEAMKGYDDAGRIVSADDEGAAVRAAVEKIMEWRTNYPNATTCVLTEWNADARATSAMLRDSLKQAGQIEAADTELDVIVRGMRDNSKATKVGFSPGDEIIFGENVQLRGRAVRNNDLARQRAIDLDVRRVPGSGWPFA